MAILEVNGLCKSFGSFEVLKNITFSLERGEVLAIIGSSGSGKTTLLRCLNYLEQADGGSIRVAGEEYFSPELSATLTDGKKRLLQLHFGLVFQSFNLFPQYNVHTNVTLAARLLEQDKLKREYKTAVKEAKMTYARDRVAKKQAVNEAKRLYHQARSTISSELSERADKLLARVGLSDHKEHFPWQLSGGQQQRVAIARALALTPDILCFDEPTSALDPELTGEVLNVIRSLKSSDTTMVVVTHEMDFAARVADKIVFMADGEIAEQGTPQELFSNPKSEALKHFLSKTNLSF